MTCASCQQTNLSGGVRCVYCGTHFPKSLDFEIDGGFSDQSTAQALPTSRSQGSKGGLGTLAALGLMALKWKSLLTLLKLGPLLTTFSTMALSISVGSRIWGWKLAAGIAVCILIHELGHVVINVKNGLRASPPMFIPFLGAVIMVKHFPADPRIESECGAGGPGAGLLASVACSLIGLATGDGFWFTLAMISYGINLFNLIPFWQLDGARISSAFSPGNWDFVLIALLFVAIKANIPLLWVLLIALFVLRLGTGSYSRYNLTMPGVRVRMALIYLALCLSLSYGVAMSGTALADIQTKGRIISANGTTKLSGRKPLVQIAQSPSTEQLDQAETARVRAVFDVVFFTFEGLIAIAGWLGTAAFLARACGEKVGKSGLVFAGSMVAIIPPLMVMTFLYRPSYLHLAYLAATLAAFIYAAYRAHHSSRDLFGNRRSVLTWRCMGWAAGAATMVAYAADSLWIAGVVLILGLLFYLRRPYLLIGVAARASELMGDLGRAISMRDRALSLNPPVEARQDLLLAQTTAYLVLGRGGDALAAVDAITTLPETMTNTSDYLVSVYRAAALIRLDRFDDVLKECERLLKTPAGDRTGALRLFLVRRILAELALYRGWDDEAIAQADQVSRMAPQSLTGTARSIAADAIRARAMALVNSGKVAETQTILEQYKLWDRQPWAQAIESTIRAALDLKQSNADAAVADTDEVARRLPGSLEATFIRGRAMMAAGKNEEGAGLLSTLSATYPLEHWGKCAAMTLASP